MAPEHADVDGRLRNWALWSRGSPRREGASSPMFSLHRSDTWEARAYGSPTTVPIDHADATRMAVAVGALPYAPRKAIHWAYLRPTNPAAKARELGVTLAELAGLVREARVMLIEQGA